MLIIMMMMIVTVELVIKAVCAAKCSGNNYYRGTAVGSEQNESFGKIECN